jgi:DNA repair exonuclease SbcCD nuclease subunit
MKKAIIFSDLHVHQYRQFNEGGRRLKNCIAFLDYIFKLAHTNEIEWILMPGDLFNNMQIMATKAVNAVATCLKLNFKEYPEITMVAISGNHDYADKNLIDAPGESALEHLSILFENFFLFKNPDDVISIGGDVLIQGIPYYEYPEHFRIALNKVIEYKTNSGMKTSILLMHQTVASGLPIEDDIEATDLLFDSFDFVFNGHIHLGQQVTDKFINVGSPMHRDAGDVGKKKGFWIVDLEDPQATISFKDITDKFPQFLYKTVGESLTEWESQQYVIWQPAVTAENTNDNLRNDKFRNTLQPAEILENYCSEVLPEEEVKDKLQYGITLLQS